MLWTCCGLWLLCASVHVSVSWPLPDTEPALYGHIQSLLEPNPYPPNLQQQWELSVPEGFRMIEASADCYNDSLTILYKDKVLGKFCGQENSTDGHHPGAKPILSPGKTLTLVTQTNESNTELHQNVSFSPHYQATEVKCPPPGSVAKGQVIPMLNEYLYRDYILVRCQKGHKLMMNGQEIKSFTAMCQSNGQWHLPLPECHIIDCGEPAPLLNGGVSFLSGELNQYGSVVQYYCDEPYYSLPGAVNDTYTCGPNGEWISSDNDVQLPKCIAVCGMPQRAPPSTARILGGKNAVLGEIPWYLLMKNPMRGGASLINDRWAVTAAHGVEGVEETEVQWFGGIVHSQSKDSVTLLSEKIIIHPNYIKGIPSSDRTNYDNDIALIRFTSRVNFGPNISPICLPENNRVLQANDVGTIAGFGVMEQNSISRKLKHAPISVFSEQMCQDKPDVKMQYTENMFCAGAEGKDSCEKDGGGPFFVPHLGVAERPFRLMGIVSWGAPCYERQHKGYYTKVQNYVQWIQDTINATENSLKQQN